MVNLSFQLYTGLTLERHFGRFRFSLIYPLSEISGNLYAARVDSYSVVVGATTGLLGLMGSQTAIFASNWKNEDLTRLDSLTLYAVSVFLTFALSSLWPHCTRISHIAAFCYGGFLGFLVTPAITARKVATAVNRIRRTAGSHLLGPQTDYQLQTVLRLHLFAV